MRIIGALMVVVVIAVSTAAVAQTTEQLDIFRNLTPEQQKVLLERMSSGDAAVDEHETAPISRAEQDAAPQSRAESPRRVDVPAVPVLAPRDTVVLEVTARAEETTAAVSPTAIEPTAIERARLDGIVSLVRSRNPYELDQEGQLNLPGFAPVVLSGLTEAQASQRLRMEPALAGLIVKLTRLPVDRQKLKPYGYDLFDEASSAFTASTDVAVPADYVVGTGDKFNLQLFGNQNRSFTLTVNRDGSINFPELGPIRVAGMTFNAAQRAIESRVAQRMIGVQANVSLGDARTIHVLVTGEAKRQGSYAVNGLATMLTGLFAAGGVTPIGSLRDIQLKRQGEIVRRLDLYDLLIGGDTSDDAKLLPGDVIFIPPVGQTVSIDGEVRRPAIYELRNEDNAADLVRIAGGFKPEADAARVSLARIDERGRRIVLDVNLNEAAGRALILRNGDVMRVSAVRPQLDAGVKLDGFVHRPGLFAWREGMRLTDVIGSVEELKPGADQHYVLIRRENGVERRVSVVSVDLTAALTAPRSTADPALMERDQIFVFDLAPGRDRIIKPLLEELRLQSDLGRDTEIVSVRGRVKVPGEFPLEPGMRVSDLLRAGGNLEPAAYGGTAELTRFFVNASGTRETSILTIDLAALRRGDAAANLPLQPYDYLLIQETPEWGEQETITLRGEVRFPGVYPIRTGETLHEVIDRAGGLTAQAFPDGSAFTRSDLRLLEQQQLDRLAVTMRGDLVALSMQAARAGQGNASDAFLTGQSLLTQLQTAKATGRFVIDLPGLLADGVHGEKDVLLRHGDELYIPKRRQEVTVVGEIQNASSHLYQRGLGRGDYVAMSGGVTRRADRSHIYVVRADGSVATQKSIKPGDTIVIPMDAERMPRLPFWQAVTQILYNVAVSVAAVNSF